MSKGDGVSVRGGVGRDKSPSTHLYIFQTLTNLVFPIYTKFSNF